MKKLTLGLFFVLALASCASPQDNTPTVAFKGTIAEDLVETPDRELMQKSPPKQYLTPGTDNGSAGVIISNNNLRAATIERRLDHLQQYVCNIFRTPVGEACRTNK